jgi:hypothetical protein
MSQPLTVLQAALELALRDAPAAVFDPADLKMCLEQLNLLNGYVRSLHDLAEIEGFEGARKPVRIIELLRNLLGRLHMDLAVAGGKECGDAFIDTDPRWLEHVLERLLVHATNRSAHDMRLGVRLEESALYLEIDASGALPDLTRVSAVLEPAPRHYRPEPEHLPWAIVKRGIEKCGGSFILTAVPDGFRIRLGFPVLRHVEPGPAAVPEHPSLAVADSGAGRSS